MNKKQTILEVLNRETTYVKDYGDKVKTIDSNLEITADKITEALDNLTSSSRIISSIPVAEASQLLQKFWQSKSDACPLECNEAEKQEAEFEAWVKENY